MINSANANLYHNGARTAAVRLLLAQPRPHLPVEVPRLHYEQYILFDSIENFCRTTRLTVTQLAEHTGCLKDGCTLIHHKAEKKVYLVLFNENIRSLPRRRFTLAHEIGHIYLGHLCDNEPEEALANFFASELLMPRVLVAALPHMPEASELAHVFGVSLAAARMRLRSLAPGAEYSEEEYALLRRYQPLLPGNEPIVEI